MITEDYVSLEIAKLLKKKGFDERCIGYYPKGKSTEINHSFLYERNSEWLDGSISAPTLQMAMKWLRNAHNIHINGDWAYKNKPEETGDFSIEYYMNIMSPDKNLEHLTDYYPTYEEAIEAAIKYCLKHLI